MKTPNRNDLCPCGSGKKYKRCCLPHREDGPPISSVHTVGGGSHRLSPPVAEYFRLGLEHYRAGRFLQAETALKQVLLNDPRNADALHVLGLLANQKGDIQSAAELISQAIERQPSQAVFYNSLGVVCSRMNGWAEAVACYHKAIEINPNFAEPHHNLGVALGMQGNDSEAITYFEKALSLKPDYVEAHNNLGFALAQVNRFGAAVECFERAIKLQPGFGEAYFNLGNALVRQGNYRKAVTSFQHALALNPNHRDAHSNLIFLLDMMPELDIASLQKERSRWAMAHATPLFQQKPYSNIPNPDRRLRIGYVSGDFREHSAHHVFGAMLTEFDRSLFDVYAYSNTKREDSVTDLFKHSATHWRKILGLSDDAVANLIQEDEIDILVDLSGHSDGNRLLVFARKPAPIQITAWGYIGGTGMTAMDIFLADPVVVPPEEKEFYTEEVRYLPCVMGSFFSQEFPLVSDLPALSADGITFGSFNRLVKISDEVFRVWAQVLLAVPNSRMVLKTGELDNIATRDRVLAHFTRAGVAQERIIILGGTSWQDHMIAFNQVDISLDPFPHGGGVTALEGLMMGVPVVTLRWPSLVGRLSASLMTTLGLTDWIADTQHDYVQLAIKMTQDLSALSVLRGKLRNLVTSSVMGNPKKYVRAVEQEYRQAWQEWCARQGA